MGSLRSIRKKQNNTLIERSPFKTGRLFRELKEQVQEQRRQFNRNKIKIDELDSKLKKMDRQKIVSQPEIDPAQSITISSPRKFRKGSTLKRIGFNEGAVLNRSNDTYFSNKKYRKILIEPENYYGFTSEDQGRMKSTSKYSYVSEPENARKQILLKRLKLLQGSLKFYE